MRLAIFHPKAKVTWTIPEIQDSETTLLLADSNGTSLARFSPPSWRVAAYRGGTIEDINNLLGASPLPTHIKNIIIAVGLNDRVTDERPLVNRMSRLRELVNVSDGSGRGDRSRTMGYLAWWPSISRERLYYDDCQNH